MHDGRKAAQSSAHETVSTLVGHRFPKSHRLQRRREFQTVFNQNRRCSNRYFRILTHSRRNQSAARLGIVVSRRVSVKAVRRNRIKRQIRECFRTSQHRLQNRDMVVIAHGVCEKASNAELRNGLLELFEQLRN